MVKDEAFDIGEVEAFVLATGDEDEGCVGEGVEAGAEGGGDGGERVVVVFDAV